ncbi:hypothetical protein SAMN04488100_10558 [Alkalibacterium putridalgicola]|uniref:Uncharacterized protein n=1 Tax=Alkalibacterium putridalgicola TaxID=426703 RepID=A0A1H7RNC0_9LACT|nr:hypothetical protein APU01nite_09560 [Alkalibacterium putridalgicola]SEL61800.1 hypothetical protein SAMN04488100_10558 [Alkalibacterium putridalgicola]
MPLSNEQRAHDLTIAALSFLLDSNSLVKENDDGDYHIDIYKEYKSLYEDTLKSINKDF